MSNAVRFWEKSVGVEIQPQAKEDGTYFWKFRFVRAYKRDGSESFEYDSYFTGKNAEGLGKVMSKVLDYIGREDATQYVQRENNQKAA